MARENRTAANELFAAGRWRSCASRAYYALYDEVTHALFRAGVTMPVNQANPKHGTLPLVVGNNLHLLSVSERWKLSGLIARLYQFRIIADYLPIVTLESDDARIAMGLLAQGFICLRDVP
jgi:uncharacterized protein (UPF0332 family)